MTAPGRSAGLAIPVVALLLASCGFHLRTWDLGETLKAVHVEADASVDLDRELAQAFRAANVELTEDADDADIVVKLSEQTQERRSAAVTAGRAAEYEMSLGVRLALETGAGEVLAPQRELRSERVARLDRDNIVGSSEEQALLATEMRNDLVDRIVRMIGTLSRQLGASTDATAG